ncbi:ferritin-like domain-containing protein [Sphingomonas bacterium]|uniref:ferritin-like domain-containing protein n=1 Tax=Sphingomonas bacterium TaxID=1895847 RepID=UPI0015762F42|nr:ferritin-like domain-containing protein [Sphingomonas bacterium]
MIDRETLQEVMEIGAARRAERRRFIKIAGAGIAAAGGLSMLSACDDQGSPAAPVAPTPSPTATTAVSDVDILNFALTLEYLEGNYYSFAAFGQGPNSSLLTGTGTQGAVVGGRQVTFADATVASYAREIAQDEITHILFLRSQLNTAAVAQPAINIDGSATGAFTAAARAAGVVSATGTFDPYASDDNWLLGAMLLTDVGVTAYKGAAALITSSVIVDAAAGILATEAYHSGLIRTLLYRRGLSMVPTDRTFSEMISTARDSLDGASDDDQGVINPGTVTANGASYPASNIVPTDGDSIVYGRTAANVLNEVFLTKTSVTSGGFFPSGINGNIKASAANA